MIRALLAATALAGISACASAQPNLILTGEGVDALREADSLPPLIERTFNASVQRVESSRAGPGGSGRWVLARATQGKRQDHP